MFFKYNIVTHTNENVLNCIFFLRYKNPTEICFTQKFKRTIADISPSKKNWKRCLNCTRNISRNKTIWEKLPMVKIRRKRILHSNDWDTSDAATDRHSKKKCVIFFYSFSLRRKKISVCCVLKDEERWTLQHRTLKYVLRNAFSSGLWDRKRFRN